MKETLKLNVVLWGDVIGRLTWDDTRQVATFQFSERYHELPYNLMPTKPQKPIPAFLGKPGDKYHGLPPFIADSLPDQWGSLIFDRWAKENGIQPRDCNPLLKLAYIGKRGWNKHDAIEVDRNKRPDALPHAEVRQAGNTDDHNKNFSFIMHPDGNWELAPAYDLTFTADILNNSGDGECPGTADTRPYQPRLSLMTSPGSLTFAASFFGALLRNSTGTTT